VTPIRGPICPWAGGGGGEITDSGGDQDTMQLFDSIGSVGTLGEAKGISGAD